MSEILLKFEWKCNDFHRRRCIWKCHMQIAVILVQSQCINSVPWFGTEYSSYRLERRPPSQAIYRVPIVSICNKFDLVITWLCINLLRQIQSGHHHADGIFKCCLLYVNGRIFIHTTTKFVPKDPVGNMQALVQVMACCQPVAPITNMD